jgi:hypothetical protein
MCAEVQPDHHADGVRLLHHGDPGRVRAGTQTELAVLEEPEPAKNAQPTVCSLASRYDFSPATPLSRFSWLSLV